MPPFVSENLEDYVAAHTSTPDSVFDDIATDVKATGGAAGMMSGRTVGYFLNTLVTISNAKRVLEVGTFVGYSALMMASALPEDGEVITCDVSEEFTSIARKHWARHPAGKKIDLRLAPATETLDTLSPPFDLVFIDADKVNYSVYYEKALGLLAPRGVIVVDNVLWGGRVLGPDDPENDDEQGATKSIKTLNEIVQADDRVVNVMLTVRDGMMLIRKRDAHLS